MMDDLIDVEDSCKSKFNFASNAKKMLKLLDRKQQHGLPPKTIDRQPISHGKENSIKILGSQKFSMVASHAKMPHDDYHPMPVKITEYDTFATAYEMEDFVGDGSGARRFRRSGDNTNKFMFENVIEKRDPVYFDEGHHFVNKSSRTNTNISSSIHGNSQSWNRGSVADKNASIMPRRSQSRASPTLPTGSSSFAVRRSRSPSTQPRMLPHTTLHPDDAMTREKGWNKIYTLGPINRRDKDRSRSRSPNLFAPKASSARPINPGMRSPQTSPHSAPPSQNMSNAEDRAQILHNPSYALSSNNSGQSIAISGEPPPFTPRVGGSRPNYRQTRGTSLRGRDFISIGTANRREPLRSSHANTRPAVSRVKISQTDMDSATTEKVRNIMVQLKMKPGEKQFDKQKMMAAIHRNESFRIAGLMNKKLNPAGTRNKLVTQQLVQPPSSSLLSSSSQAASTQTARSNFSASKYASVPSTIKRAVHGGTADDFIDSYEIGSEYDAYLTPYTPIVGRSNPAPAGAANSHNSSSANGNLPAIQNLSIITADSYLKQNMDVESDEMKIFAPAAKSNSPITLESQLSPFTVVKPRDFRILACTQSPFKAVTPPPTSMLRGDSDGYGDAAVGVSEGLLGSVFGVRQPASGSSSPRSPGDSTGIPPQLDPTRGDGDSVPGIILGSGDLSPQRSRPRVDPSWRDSGGDRKRSMSTPRPATQPIAITASSSISPIKVPNQLRSSSVSRVASLQTIPTATATINTSSLSTQRSFQEPTKIRRALVYGGGAKPAIDLDSSRDSDVRSVGSSRSGSSSVRRGRSVHRRGTGSGDDDQSMHSDASCSRSRSHSRSNSRGRQRSRSHSPTSTLVNSSDKKQFLMNNLTTMKIISLLRGIHVDPAACAHNKAVMINTIHRSDPCRLSDLIEKKLRKDPTNIENAPPLLPIPSSIPNNNNSYNNNNNNNNNNNSYNNINNSKISASMNISSVLHQWRDGYKPTLIAGYGMPPSS